MRDLGSTFARNRDRAQRREEFDIDRRMRAEDSAADRSLREREFSERGQDRDLDRQMRESATKENATRHAEILKTEQGQQAIKQLNDAHKALQENVDTGRMTPEEAAARAADIRQAIQTMGSLAWQNSQFGLVGHTFKKSQAAPGITPQPFEVGGQKGIVNPKTGHFAVDKPPPAAGTMTITPGEPGEPPQTNFNVRLSPQQLDEKMRGMAGGGGSAAPALTPLPATKEELVVGTVYKTPKGNARWNGRMFDPVP